MGRTGRRKKDNNSLFENLALILTKFSGSTTAFVLSISLIVGWAISGFFTGFTEVWQLVINTGTTIITFLMVFLIQRTQNKDSMAIQLKLNELIASLAGASNKLVDIEDISEKELETLKKHYQKLALMFDSENHITESHSIAEAEKRHKRKAALK